MAGKPRTLVGASRIGDRLEELKLLRVLTSEAITAARDEGKHRELSPLIGKLMEIGVEIEQIEDELAEAAELAEEAAVDDEPFNPDEV